MRKTIINKLGREEKRNIKKIDGGTVLNDRADAVYTDSSYVIYKDLDEDIYYIGQNGSDTPYEIGNIQELDEYFESEDI